MADLGAVAVAVWPPRYALLIRSFPDYIGTALNEGVANLSGTLGGTILEAGVALENCEVLVLWRPTMKVIARTWTDVNGDWEIGGIDPTKTEHYTVVIKDKGGGTVYNDAIYALVAPV